MDIRQQDSSGLDFDAAKGLIAGPFSIWKSHGDLDRLAEFMLHISPHDRLALERFGCHPSLVAVLGNRLGLCQARMKELLLLPHDWSPTAPESPTPREGVQRLYGAPAFALLAIMQLLGMARTILGDSRHPVAAELDTARWLGGWLEVPIVTMVRSKPSDLIALPTGLPFLLQRLEALRRGSFL